MGGGAATTFAEFEELGAGLFGLRVRGWTGAVAIGGSGRGEVVAAGHAAVVEIDAGEDEGGEC